MSAGTLALTNQSATVTGTGTTFTTELKTGDFIGVIVGGVPYTLVVLNIASDTSLTIGAAYTGPTNSDLAWYAVPATLQVAITQKVLNDVATMTRGMILDKDNWQQFYTGEGDITINLPDTSPVTGPSWPAMQKTISDGLKGKAASGSNSDITEIKGLTTALSIEQGGTGKTKAEDAITAIGGLPASGGTMKGALSWISTAVLQSSLGNLGFTAIDTNGHQSSITVNTSIGAFTIKFGSVVVTANAAGEGTVSYPVAFSSKVDTVLVTDGDNAVNSVDGNIYIINFNGTRTAGFDYHAVNRANAIMRINFIAIGR